MGQMKLPWRFQRPKYIPPSWIPLPELCPTPWTPTRYYPSEIKMFLRYTPPPPLPLNLSLFFTKKRWRLRHFVRVDLEHRYAPSRDPVPIRSIPIFILLLGSLSFETFLFWGNIYIYRVWRACRNNWYDEFLISSIHVQVIWIERIIS